MHEVLGRAEPLRLKLRLRQGDVARELGVSQGHYSKVARGQTPLASELAKRLEAWVEKNDVDEPEQRNLDVLKMTALAASIQRQCLELLKLSALASTPH